MGTIEQKINYLNGTKESIKQAIINKGVNVADDDTFRSYADKISSISAMESTKQYLCRIIDYDGTVLKSDKLNEGDIFTLLDEFPTHERLVAQQYSSPVDIVDNAVTVGNSDIIIGITYTTKSGLSEFDITLTRVTGLSVTLNMDGTKDWGDGTSDTETSHTYTDYGDYMITCNGTTMTASSSSTGLFGQGSSSVNYTFTEIRLANITTIESYAFGYCYSLASITIPEEVISIGTYGFQKCYSLTSIIIPKGLTTIANYLFYGCDGLVSIIIPKGLTTIGTNVFYSCASLASIIIPEGVTSISTYAFGYCYSLASITIPEGLTWISANAFMGCTALTSMIISEGITTISNYICKGCHALTSITIPASVTYISENAFAQCYSIIKYDFSNRTTVPRLQNTTVFSGINNICKIIVPDDLYDEWIAATNWSDYADYIYKASEV